MKNKILVGVGLSACAIAWAAKDPVIMTINGVDVPKSEFEYLYHKNSQQQLAPQPLEEYAEMFKVYKLKVADAKACGLDTTESFRKEMQQYRRELAAPFMADSAYINKLVAEAAARALEDVEASHIMMLKTRDAAENRRLRLRLDSLRQELIAGADFTDLALRRILTEPKNAIVRQYKKIFLLDGVELIFTDDALDLIVDKAVEYKLGARGLRSIVETIMVDAMFEVPSQPVKTFTVDAAYALGKLEKAHFEKMEISDK